MLAIAWKDVRQHWGLMAAFLGMGLLVPWLYLWLPDSAAPRLTLEQLSVLRFSCATILPVVAPISVANWLMAQERTKRTFLVLRMLPVSTSLVIGAKEFVALSYVLCVCVVSVGSFVVAFRCRLGMFPLFPPAAYIVIGLAVLTLLTETTLWLLLHFEQKWALQFPGLVAILLWNAPILLRKLPGHMPALTLAETECAIAFAGLFMSVALHKLMVHEFDRQDWAMPSSE
jgi:hypothetical protein